MIRRPYRTRESMFAAALLINVHFNRIYCVISISHAWKVGEAHRQRGWNMGTYEPFWCDLTINIWTVNSYAILFFFWALALLDQACHPIKPSRPVATKPPVIVRMDELIPGLRSRGTPFLLIVIPSFSLLINLFYLRSLTLYLSAALFRNVE